MNTKQVIVMRTDLNMRKGKMIAQGSHASMKVLLDIMKEKESTNSAFKYDKVLDIIMGSPLENWLSGLFTKIVVSINSEEELLNIYNKAKEKNILCSLIQDSGSTEFNGVPTYTCCAIGPDESEKINEITGNLKLL